HEVEPVADIVANRLRHGDAPGLGDTFQPGGDIDPVAANTVVVDDHVAKVDADAKFDPPILHHGRVADRHVALDFHGAFDCVHDAGKFDQHAVAGQLDDPPLMLGDGRVDQL